MPGPYTRKTMIPTDTALPPSPRDRRAEPSAAATPVAGATPPRFETGSKALAVWLGVVFAVATFGVVVEGLFAGPGWFWPVVAGCVAYGGGLAAQIYWMKPRGVLGWVAAFAAAGVLAGAVSWLLHPAWPPLWTFGVWVGMPLIFAVEEVVGGVIFELPLALWRRIRRR